MSKMTNPKAGAKIVRDDCLDNLMIEYNMVQNFNSLSLL